MGHHAVTELLLAKGAAMDKAVQVRGQGVNIMSSRILSSRILESDWGGLRTVRDGGQPVCRQDEGQHEVGVCMLPCARHNQPVQQLMWAPSRHLRVNRAVALNDPANV